jgi:hypothetical protein
MRMSVACRAYLFAVMLLGPGERTWAQSPPPAPERVQWIQVGPGAMAAMPDSLRARLVDSLRAGRARWAARAPKRYQIETTVGCWCSSAGSPDAPRRPLVEVRDRRIVSMREAPVRDSIAARSLVWLPWTIDSVFASAERDLHDPQRSIMRFELDPHYGFPRRINSDLPGTSDSWTHIEVRRFKPIAGRRSRPAT